eukprot:6172585-Pleurochrysis_carterae.AAC.3
MVFAPASRSWQPSLRTRYGPTRTTGRRPIEEVPARRTPGRRRRCRQGLRLATPSCSQARFRQSLIRRGAVCDMCTDTELIHAARRRNCANRRKSNAYYLRHSFGMRTCSALFCFQRRVLAVRIIVYILAAVRLDESARPVHLH